MPGAPGVDPGATEMPDPREDLPAPPLIVSQTGLGDPTEPPTLTTASLWEYCLVYAHEHAARDRVALTLDLNLGPSAAMVAGAADGSCPFSAMLACQAGAERRLESWALTRLDGTVGPGLDWPQVACRAADGSWAPLIADTMAGATRIWRPEPGAMLMLEAWPCFALSWPGLNVGAVQNMRARLEAVREVDPPGPDGPATADAVVHRSAIVTAADIVTPGIGRTDPLAITGATIAAALQAAFDSLFPPAARRDDLRLTLGLTYGCTIAPGPDPLVSRLPVGLMPDHLLTDRTAAQVAEVLQGWRDAVGTIPAGGFWEVSLKLHSSFDPSRRVLLSLDRLTWAPRSSQ